VAAEGAATAAHAPTTPAPAAPLRTAHRKVRVDRPLGSFYRKVVVGGNPVLHPKCTVRNWALHAGLNRLGCIQHLETPRFRH